MKHLQNWYDSAVLGIVAVAKPCEAARRCVHLQGWHDCAVEGIVEVAKLCGAARRCLQMQSWQLRGARHRGATVFKPCDAARRGVHLQEWHDSAVQGIVAVAKP